MRREKGQAAGAGAIAGIDAYPTPYGHSCRWL